MAQHVFGEGVEDVQAVDLVPLGDGQVEGDKRHRVGLGDAERTVQTRDEVRELVEIYKLRGVWIIPGGE